MSPADRHCPDCDSSSDSISRRKFLRNAGVAGAAAVAAGAIPAWSRAADATAGNSPAAGGALPESLVKGLFESLSDQQKAKVCFGWDHVDKRGLLRTRVENNWHITQPTINSDFFTKDQQAMVRQIFEGIIQPDWHQRIYKQLEDDAGGFGEDQNIAIFGTPGSDQFEFVMTGRHMTMRCDGHTSEHVAFGGPIFYGHAASGFNEKPNHPGNVYWNQALAANKVFEMLDGNQRKAALVERLPKESQVAFRGSQALPGLAVSEMTSDQRELVQEVLKKLIEPYRQSDRDEVAKCLKAQGGLDKCALAFYREGDLGGDQVWDCWRLEGPSFVWYYRGTPHVHVWVNVADNADVKTNAAG
jgi:hypothetical protein